MGWGVYKVESYLEPMVNVIIDTLAHHCKKGEWIDHPIGQAVTFKFMVSKQKSRAGPVLKAEGRLGKCKFIFRSDGRGAVFSANYYQDTEDTFRQFVVMINFYRKDLGLESLDYDSLYDIVEEDSPPVGADNYALFGGADIKSLTGVLSRDFEDRAHREISGKYSIIVYSENARTINTLYGKNIPVYQKFLGAFKEFYGFNGAMFVCVRRGKEQHIYFYAQGKGIFYNTQDAGKEFLEQEHGVLTKILSSKARVVRNRLQMVGNK
jgi:hypothetical protein